MTYKVFGGTISLTQSINQPPVIFTGVKRCEICPRSWTPLVFEPPSFLPSNMAATWRVKFSDATVPCVYLFLCHSWLLVPAIPVLSSLLWEFGVIRSYRHLRGGVLIGEISFSRWRTKGVELRHLLRIFFCLEMADYQCME